MEVETDLELIISGKHVGIENKLDYESKISKEDFERIPVTKRNVCYICSCVLFNESGEVLLVQEAKNSCRGQWYLPAGRLEPGETIIDGALRELKEEAGLEGSLTTLLCVEIQHVWIRFTFTGKITGGKLKTLAEKDGESLQAKFFSLDNMPTDLRETKRKALSPDQPVLRCNDVLKLVKLGREFHAKEESQRPPCCIPVIHPHKHITHRFVILDTDSPSANHPVKVLISTQGNTTPHIPCLFVNILRTADVKAMVAYILKEACSSKPFEDLFQKRGLLGVEHRGTGESEDGLCFTHLICLTSNSSNSSNPPPVTSNCYSWHPLQSVSLREKLTSFCLGKIVPLL